MWAILQPVDVWCHTMSCINKNILLFACYIIFFEPLKIARFFSVFFTCIFRNKKQQKNRQIFYDIYIKVCQLRKQCDMCRFLFLMWYSFKCLMFINQRKYFVFCVLHHIFWTFENWLLFSVFFTFIFRNKKNQKTDKYFTNYISVCQQRKQRDTCRFLFLVWYPFECLKLINQQKYFVFCVLRYIFWTFENCPFFWCFFHFNFS